MTNPSRVDIPPPLVLRPGRGERIGVTALAVFLTAVALTVSSLNAATLFAFPPLFLPLLPFTAIVFGLTYLTIKEAASRWMLLAAVEYGSLTLRLPVRRGHIEMPAVKMRLSLGDIERIETRAESFSSIGTTTIQQAYRLFLRDGRSIHLGADRDLIPAFFAKLVGTLVSRIGVAVIDKGTVEGKAGFLLVFGQSVPNWSTPSVPDEQAAALQKRRARSLFIMFLAVALVAAARFLVGD